MGSFVRRVKDDPSDELQAIQLRPQFLVVFLWADFDLALVPGPRPRFHE